MAAIRHSAQMPEWQSVCALSHSPNVGDPGERGQGDKDVTNPSAHPLAAFLFIVHALHFLDDGQVTKHYPVCQVCGQQNF